MSAVDVRLSNDDRNSSDHCCSNEVGLGCFGNSSTTEQPNNGFCIICSTSRQQAPYKGLKKPRVCSAIVVSMVGHQSIKKISRQQDIVDKVSSDNKLGKQSPQEANSDHHRNRLKDSASAKTHFMHRKLGSTTKQLVSDTVKGHKAVSSSADMSKLSPALKQLINAPFSKPSYTIPNPQVLQPALSRLAASAKEHNVSTPAWLTFSTATAMTMNAPSAMTALWQTAQESDRTLHPVVAAELQREVGLKCISFNGIPRTINCLGAFYNSLPADVRTKLSTIPTREFTPSNIESRKSDGLGLWDSVYFGFERKLLDKLGQSHPDLPVHIIQAHYSSLLSNPSRPTYTTGEEKPRETHIGRVLTSLIAIACLRAQTGVGPQVVSHVFGLRKAYERGDAHNEGEVEIPGGEWLSGEAGNKWLLESIDELVRAIGTRQDGDADGARAGENVSTTFAPGMGPAQQQDKPRAKL